MSNPIRALSILAWDGILPILVAVTPLLIKTFIPIGRLVEVIAAVLLPIFFALARIHIGSIQLSRATGGNVGLKRQLLFACAIILLLMFEMYAMILHFANDEPASAWLVPSILLVFYIVVIWFALRPTLQGQEIRH